MPYCTLDIVFNNCIVVSSLWLDFIHSLSMRHSKNSINRGGLNTRFLELRDVPKLMSPPPITVMVTMYLNCLIKVIIVNGQHD